MGVSVYLSLQIAVYEEMQKRNRSETNKKVRYEPKKIKNFLLETGNRRRKQKTKKETCSYLFSDMSQALANKQFTHKSTGTTLACATRFA